MAIITNEPILLTHIWMLTMSVKEREELWFITHCLMMMLESKYCILFLRKKVLSSYVKFLS